MEKSPQRILLVDDIVANLVMLEALLQHENIEIIKATSGKNALKILRRQEVALILLDVMMPDMDGYQLAEKIRTLDNAQFTPIIFVTGTNDTGKEHNLFKGYQVGAVDVLYKPMQPEVIRSKVKVFLELDEQRRLVKEQARKLEDALAQLQDYAQHDQLTGLFNRDQVVPILGRLMSNAQRRKNQQKLGLLFLDLDHFKNINDSLGHDVGDELLQSVSQRIKNAIRRGDFVFRLGGDEFAIILNELDSPEAAGLVAQKILDQLIMPHALSHHEVLISSSIGISLYEDFSLSPSELLKSADTAMYQAKQKGRSQFAFYSAELEQRSAQRIQIARDLSDAIDLNELSVYYQAQICTQTLEVTGFEALLRWQHKGQFISPGTFIPIAEDTGLIPKLGAWVLRTACHQLKQWIDAGLFGATIKVSVNVSNRQLQASNFMDVIADSLTASQLPPQCLELELTESTLMQEPEKVIATFTAIQKLGIEIAVDDFGTGYSSLSYLKKLPIDRLKIDQSFVREIALGEDDDAVVKAIIGLSHNLGLKVVAEGVETPQQLQFLEQYQCDVLQGYFFSKPLPAEQITHFLEEFKTKQHELRNIRPAPHIASRSAGR